MARTRSLVLAAHGDLIVERDPGRSTGRLLRQDDMQASYIDLSDARYLEFDYLRWIRLALRAFGARRVLHLGGAACTLARALLAEDGGARHEVVELDQRVFDIAREHLGLRRQPGLKLRVGDGRAAVTAHSDNSIDAIVIDAFIGARVPRHLVTAQALAECARVAPLTVINVVDTSGWPDARAIAAGLAEVYSGVAGLAGSARGGGNIALLGFGTVPHSGRLESMLVADPSPARLLSAADLAGSYPWRDEVDDASSSSLAGQDGR